MQKILRSAEEIFNDAISGASSHCDYYYESYDERAYWEEDGKYYYLGIDEPSDCDLRDVLDMLNDNGYSDLDDALTFYDRGSSSSNEWDDYLNWFVNENSSDKEEIEPEVEDIDTKEYFDFMVNTYKGMPFEQILELTPSDRKIEKENVVVVEYKDLAFTFKKDDNGKVTLLGEVKGWEYSDCEYVDSDTYDDILIYEPTKEEYKMDREMLPLDSVISSVKKSVMELLDSCLGTLSIDPHFDFKVKVEGMENITWDEVAIPNCPFEKMKVSFITGTVKEPISSVDISLDKFPVEEIIRMYNSLQ